MTGEAEAWTPMALAIIDALRPRAEADPDGLATCLPDVCEVMVREGVPFRIAVALLEVAADALGLDKRRGMQ